MRGCTIRAFVPDDMAWATELADRAVAGRLQVRRGEAIDALSVPGFVAERDGELVGLLTYRVQGTESELVLLAVTKPGGGIGSALIDAWFYESRDAGCVRLWVVTTNDNLRALGFYQRHGLRLASLRPRAVEFARRIKPAIPDIGEDGIPIRDEVELERFV